jgi:hypothetical protein
VQHHWTLCISAALPQPIRARLYEARLSPYSNLAGAAASTGSIVVSRWFCTLDKQLCGLEIQSIENPVVVGVLGAMAALARAGAVLFMI